MTKREIIGWIREGDVSLDYQVSRDLLHQEQSGKRKRMAMEGWGARILACRGTTGHWGRGFYQPKWTCTHYTLLDLKQLAIPPDLKPVRDTLRMIFDQEKGPDGGLKPIGADQQSDVCINGMALNYACYFHVEEQDLYSVVDFLLSQRLPDGGFNCQYHRKGAHHSSVHTTLSVLEGIHSYSCHGYSYRLGELETAARSAREFLLLHRLFRSDHTGAVINSAFLKFYYPCRWYYDVLRAMDYFQEARIPYDPRMDDALSLIRNKRTPEGLWKLAAPHPGQTHLVMEPAGRPSRWNTLRALRVLQHFGESNPTGSGLQEL